MNTINEHLEKATHNLAFLNIINTNEDTYTDWAIVILFYRALHLVSAVIHHQNQNHGNNHVHRLQAANRVLSPTGFLRYDRLYKRSRLVRYDLVRSAATEYNQLLTSDFAPLLQEVQTHLASAV